MTAASAARWNPQRRGRWSLALVWPLVLGVLPTAARADNLDVQLNQRVPQLLKALAHEHCKHVGVVKFRVEKEGPRHSFSTTQLGGNLATRLENALILHIHEDETRAIGVIADAGRVASARKISVSDRSKLFSIGDYPLAWGNRKVKPDAFLTGVVKVSANLAKTTVQINLFTAREPMKLKRLAEFTVDTDRALLHDLGETFALDRRIRYRSAREMDKYAVVDANNRDHNQPTAESIDPQNVFGFQMKILYDGVEQSITRDTFSAGEWRVVAPQPGQKIVVRVIPQINQRMGMVLKVNGESTMAREKDEPIRCTRWILTPRSNGINQDHEGFYFYGAKQEVLPFRALTPEESYSRESEFDDRFVGTIRLDIFDQGGTPGTVPGSPEPMTPGSKPQPTGKPAPSSTPGKPAPSSTAGKSGTSSTVGKQAPSSTGGKPPSTNSAPAEEMSITLRNGGPAKSLQERKASTLKANRLSRRGNLIVADTQSAPTPDVNVVPFPNPRHLGGITVRYYDPAKAFTNK